MVGKWQVSPKGAPSSDRRRVCLAEGEASSSSEGSRRFRKRLDTLLCFIYVLDFIDYSFDECLFWHNTPVNVCLGLQPSLYIRV